MGAVGCRFNNRNGWPTPELHLPAARHRGLKITKNHLSWAWGQTLPAAHKLTLLSIVDHVNKDSEAWPCAKKLIQMTGLNRKTVQKTVVDLKNRGLIFDTGRRVGSTNQVIVYLVGKEAQKRACLTPPVTNPLSAVETPPKTGDGRSSKHRPQKPPARKAKFPPVLRLIVGGE